MLVIPNIMIFGDNLMKSLETQYIKAEVRQRREEGCDVGDISGRVDAA